MNDPYITLQEFYSDAILQKKLISILIVTTQPFNITTHICTYYVKLISSTYKQILFSFILLSTAHINDCKQAIENCANCLNKKISFMPTISPQNASANNFNDVRFKIKSL